MPAPEGTRGRSAAAAMIVAAALVAGCARTLPADRSEASLYRDIERLVTLSEAAGWNIDRLEVDDLLAETLDSVCRVDRAHRQALLAWIDTAIARAGGPVEDAWRQHGKDLGAVDDLVTLTRIRSTLDHAMTAADADCPFWLEPERPFRGRQISDDHWELVASSGGKLILVHQGGRNDINAGGAGRLLVGRTFGSRGALYVGGEIGAAASFPKDAQGTRQALVFGFDVVAPVVYRHSFVNTYFEAETGWLGTSTENALADIIHGVHVGLAIGGRASRARWFFPGVAFGASYERTFPGPGEAAPRTTIKFGLRAAVDLDL